MNLGNEKRPFWATQEDGYSGLMDFPFLQLLDLLGDVILWSLFTEL